MYDYYRYEAEARERTQRREREAAAERIARSACADRRRRRLPKLTEALRYLRSSRRDRLASEA